MDNERQRTEIVWLKRRWRENLEVEDDDPDYISGKFTLAPFLTPDYRMRYKDYNREVRSIKISALPPIQLFFQLPADYPTREMPFYQIFCLWLSQEQLRVLCDILNSKWQRYYQSEILELWANFLQEEALASLGYEGCLDLTKDLDWGSPVRKKMKFSVTQTKGCGRHRVLMSDHTLPVEDFIINYNRNIAQVNNESRTLFLSDEELLQIDYDDIIQCPRCYGSVLLENKSDTVAICSSCTNVFCCSCRRTYHGFQHCHIPRGERLKTFLAFTSEETSKEEKEAYLKKYGHQCMTRLVRQYGGSDDHVQMEH
ncbi:E3 ubiquitin-protein ligase RNF14 [Halyomorpha halys]|uniref:E3 ubiquitin-protein ligase RNF14 n=1 Tax=Halyomorpha halys TaxID=286706 RepID=UPI0006D529A9|nr:E3 ubiquitin-protein ligase RNF14-like [Halyomorpha halys]